MASTIERLLIDTVHLVESIAEDDMAEARFRCESIINVAWGDAMLKVGHAAMALAFFLRESKLSKHAERDAALAELIAQVETQAAPLREGPR